LGFGGEEKGLFGEMGFLGRILEALLKIDWIGYEII
jgi:hypothetical protein